MERFSVMEGYPRFRISEETEEQTSAPSPDTEAENNLPSEQSDVKAKFELEKNLITPEGVSTKDHDVPNIEKRLLALMSPPRGAVRAMVWRFAVSIERSRIESNSAINRNESASADLNKGEVRDRRTILSEAILLRILSKLVLPILQLIFTHEYRAKLQEYTQLLQSTTTSNS